MRIIEDRTKKDKSDDLIRVECEKCSSVFEIEKDELDYGEFGVGNINCPCCGHNMYLDDYYIDLTYSNFIYPKHFSKSTCEEMASDKKINDAIRAGIDFFRNISWDDEEVWYMMDGGTVIFIIRDNESECYDIFVARDCSIVTLDFEEEDFESNGKR